ncbi:MAG: hypothetical protein IJQ11_06575 [Bacteroidales bacterium]|nr:hypothetical protein [Bacteroidales bacterium]
MNLATAIVLLIVLGMVVWAIHSLRSGEGRCSCGESGKPAGNKCASCAANCPFKR